MKTKTFAITTDHVEAMDYDALRDAYMRFEWTVKGFVTLDIYTGSMSDMRNALLWAIKAGIMIRDFPSHPAEYNTTVGELYEALPPDTRDALKAQGYPQNPSEPALWGKGWFGDVLPGYMGTIAWQPKLPTNWVDGSGREALGPQAINPMPGVERNRLADYRSRGCEDELQPIEEAAADGDFLSHLKIRALFLGVASVMASASAKDMMLHAAKRLPVPTLAAYVRLYKHRDTPPYNMRTGRYGKSASESYFETPNFYNEAIGRGRQAIVAVGGFELPDLMMAPPLELVVNDVSVEMHFPRLIGINSEVVDVIGMDAAEGAFAKAAEELGLYGITVGPAQMDI